MKVGDKVWVQVKVLEVASGSVHVSGHSRASWWMFAEQCKPVEPEAVEQPPKKEPTEAQKIAERTLKAIWATHPKPEPDTVIKQSLNTDAVNPSHYKQLPAEVIDIIEAAIANAQNNKVTGLHWKVLKYALRCWEDLKKARWYLDRLIQEEEAK